MSFDLDLMLQKAKSSDTNVESTFKLPTRK